MKVLKAVDARAADVYLVSHRELASIIGMSPRRISQLVADGMPKSGPDRYDLGICVRWWVDRWRGKEADSEEGVTQRQRLTRMQADKVQTEVQILRGTLVRAIEVEHVMAAAAAVVAGSLDSIGPRVAGEVAELQDPALIQEVLLRETRSIRESLADAFSMAAAGATLADDADEEPDAGIADHETTAVPQRRPVGRPRKDPSGRKSRARPVAVDSDAVHDPDHEGMQ